MSDSSYSNIGREDAESGNELSNSASNLAESRHTEEFEDTSPLFRTLYAQAQSLVDNDNMIMPFSTPTGHVHLVRHLSPDLAYIQESLTGRDGISVHHISGWVRQVVIVVGDNDRLNDSEDESAAEDEGEKWWAKEGITGIGKRIDVVDSDRIGEDWSRRVRGQD